MADDPLADPSKIDKSDGAKPRVSMGLSGNIQPHPYSNKARPTNYFDIDSLVQSFHGGEGGAKSWSRIVVTKVLQRVSTGHLYIYIYYPLDICCICLFGSIVWNAGNNNLTQTQPLLL